MIALLLMEMLNVLVMEELIHVVLANVFLILKIVMIALLTLIALMVKLAARSPQVLVMIQFAQIAQLTAHVIC